jgi:hypothetical protein
MQDTQCPTADCRRGSLPTCKERPKSEAQKGLQFQQACADMGDAEASDDSFVDINEDTVMSDAQAQAGDTSGVDHANVKDDSASTNVQNGSAGINDDDC